MKQVLLGYFKIYEVMANQGNSIELLGQLNTKNLDWFRPLVPFAGVY